MFNDQFNYLIDVTNCSCIQPSIALSVDYWQM